MPSEKEKGVIKISLDDPSAEVTFCVAYFVFFERVYVCVRVCQSPPFSRAELSAALENGADRFYRS